MFLGENRAAVLTGWSKRPPEATFELHPEDPEQATSVRDFLGEDKACMKTIFPSQVEEFLEVSTVKVSSN